MNSILYLKLQGFLVREVRTRLAAEAKTLPLAVHDGEVILESCPAALAKGVVPGMSVKESKALLREEGRHEKLKPEDLQEGAEAWLDLCSECSSAVEPLSPCEAFVDLSGHPDPGAVASELLSLVFRREGLGLSAGLSPVKWISRLASAPCDPQALQLGLLPIEPVASPSQFAAALPVSRLPGVDPRLKERLVFLGCRFVHQALLLAPPTLKKQFGAEAPRLRALLLGQGREKVKALHPSESLEARVVLEGPIEDSLLVDEALKLLAQNLALELGRRDRQAEALTLTAYPEEGPWMACRRKLGKPVLSSSLILVALRRMIADHPLAQPVVRFVVRAEKLTPRQSWQQGLDGSLPSAQQQAAIQSATRMVEAMFGEGKVAPASQMVLPRRLKVLKVWKHATGWR